MLRFILCTALTLGLPTAAQPALVQDDHDALNSMWLAMAAEENGAPDYPDGYAETLAVCILEVRSPLDREDKDLPAEAEMNPDEEAAARIDTIIPDRGMQFPACGEKDAEKFG